MSKYTCVICSGPQNNQFGSLQKVSNNVQYDLDSLSALNQGITSHSYEINDF